MKKLFIISGSFFLLVLIFLGVYNFAFRHNSTNPTADAAKKEEVEKKREAETVTDTRPVVFQQVIPENVQDPVADEKGIMYYSPRENAIKKAGFDGKPGETLLSQLPGIPTRIVWSSNRLAALLLIHQNGSELWYSADIGRQSITALKPNMSRLAWTSLGDRIFYEYTDGVSGERTLNISAPDGSNWNTLVNLGKEDHFIATIPQSSMVALWKKTDSLRESTLETVNMSGDGRRTLLSGRFGADFLWSPDGQRILVQSVTERGGQVLALGLTDENGKYRDLSAPTLVSKAVWSKDNETFFYALPGPFPTDAVLPNDYFAKSLHSKDTFWKMNIRTGKKERLVPLEEMTQAFDATHLFLSPSETDLYFVDRISTKLYQITL